MLRRMPVTVCLLTAALLSGGCGRTIVVDRFYRSDGSQLWMQPWYRDAAGTKVAHGEAWYWYRSGGQRDHITYQDGQLHGTWTHWYENGPKAFQCTFVNGEIDGRVRIWDPHGKKVCDGRFKLGQAWDGSFYTVGRYGSGAPGLTGSIMHCRKGHIEKTMGLSSLDSDTRAALFLYAARRAPAHDY